MQTHARAWSGLRLITSKECLILKILLLSLPAIFAERTISSVTSVCFQMKKKQHFYK
jgi:hypothetical protein